MFKKALCFCLAFDTELKSDMRVSHSFYGLLHAKFATATELEQSVFHLCFSRKKRK